MRERFNFISSKARHNCSVAWVSSARFFDVHSFQSNCFLLRFILCCVVLLHSVRWIDAIHAKLRYISDDTMIVINTRARAFIPPAQSAAAAAAVAAKDWVCSGIQFNAFTVCAELNGVSGVHLATMASIQPTKLIWSTTHIFTVCSFAFNKKTFCTYLDDFEIVATKCVAQAKSNRARYHIVQRISLFIWIEHKKKTK